MPDTHDDGRVPLRQRSIPDQLDHFGDKLGGLLDRANLDRDMLIVIGAAVVNLGAIAAQLRKQDEQLAAATARAEKAEVERDAWKSEAERRSSERNAAVRRIGLVRECLNAPGELLPGLAELLENGTGRALSATETDADGSQGSADGRTPVRAAAGLSERCRATKVEGGVRHHCDSDAPHDTHECGDCAHRWDDTTEDGQHG